MRNTTLGTMSSYLKGQMLQTLTKMLASSLKAAHTILENLNNEANACSMMLGLIYALNLAYPQDLRYTFETFQKIFMELDAKKLSNKVQVLKNK